MATLTTLLGRLDADPVRRGRQWERLCAWWLAHDPGYRSQVRQVWLWSEWPGRWGVDSGIDLVAEDRDRRLWAIQAKCYDPGYTVTKRDLDTFLSESSRPQFSFRLLIATTDLLSDNARRTIEGQEKAVGLLLRGDMERSPVEWPDDPAHLVGPPLPPKAPRPHQEEALADILAGFGEHDRGQLIMACGTGKTLVGLWAAERLGATRTLVLLPSLSLLAQVLDEWCANAAEPFPFLPVCSDPTVRGEDEWVSSTADLGFPVTTDPTEIAGFLRRRGRRVVFSTYQSSPRIAEAQALGRVPGFDLVIADEAHRTAGPASTEFATVLDPKAIRARRRLFMTATPRYFTGRVIKAAREEADLEVASMDDPARYGPVFHRLTFGEAISRDLLSDYRVVIVGVDDHQVHEMATTARLVRLEGTKAQTDAHTLAAHLGLAKAMRRFDLHRTITFHGRVKRARDFAADLPRVVGWMPSDQTPDGTVWAEHVSGDMPTGTRTVRLDRLRHLGTGERGVLSNARCLAEGVDVPTLDGVAFIDPKGSQTDIVQAVGRAIRKAEDKTLGTIVLPVFIEGAEDPERALEASAFKPVWSVLRALRDQDETLAEELDSIRRNMGRQGTRGTGDGITKVVIDIPVGVDFVRALQARLVERATSNWEYMYGLLERFVEREGHALVPVAHLEAGYRLGGWVDVQRQRRNRGAIPAGPEQRLQCLPGWSWNPHAEQWDRAYEHLMLFAEREGHARVPIKHREAGFPLGHWVVKQRQAHQRGLMDSGRVERLESAPGWVWEPYEAAWEEGYQALVLFSQREGHCRVPARHMEHGFHLGQWVNARRTAYKNHKIAAERVAQLEALPGWTWDDWDDRWERAFSVLERFVAEHGTARVPQKAIVQGFRLGIWVTHQRTLYRQGEQSAGRVGRLESLPGWEWAPTHSPVSKTRRRRKQQG